jgi:hypothetical protein
MNKEQIESLVEYAQMTSVQALRVLYWFEQNPIEPVGLSDEQVIALVDSLQKLVLENRLGSLSARMRVLIDGFLMTQKSEKSEIKEVPVGLSDEQIQSLVDYTYCDSDTFDAIKEWSKTQTFARPVEFSDVELSDAYQRLMEDYQDLRKELKAQFLNQPNWDDAPEWANWVAQDFNGAWHWFKNKPLAGNHKGWTNGYWGYKEQRNSPVLESIEWQQTLQQRPASTVGAGQTWVKVGCVDGIAQSVSIDYASDQVVVFSAHYTNGKQQHYSLSDFLALFERVKS